MTFAGLTAHADVLPDVAPVICEDCGFVSLLVSGTLRKVTGLEFDAVKRSPLWLEMILPLQRARRMLKHARMAVNN
jgi:hypothetical protein